MFTYAIVIVAWSIACISAYQGDASAALYAAQCRLRCFAAMTPTYHHDTCEYSREDLCGLQDECVKCWDLCYKLEFDREQYIDLCFKLDQYCVSMRIKEVMSCHADAVFVILIAAHLARVIHPLTAIFLFTLRSNSGVQRHAIFKETRSRSSTRPAACWPATTTAATTTR